MIHNKLTIEKNLPYISPLSTLLWYEILPIKKCSAPHNKSRGAGIGSPLCYKGLQKPKFKRLLETRGTSCLISTFFFQTILETMKAVASPKREAHVSGDRNPMMDLYSMREHSLSTIHDHIMQSDVDVRISDQTFLPEDINLL